MYLPPPKKKAKKKNPSEFVIMIDSCAQKTGNLFQNFHDFFFFFWSFAVLFDILE